MRVDDQAIRVRDLRMAYGNQAVVHGIDIDVRIGEVFAFLGPNGAGKTTTVEILEGFRHRTGGDVTVLGVDPQLADPQWRGRLGVVLQTCVPEPDLTVRETVDLYAGFYPAPLRTEEVLVLTGLSEIAGTLNRRLSGGQQRRLDVALALVGDPDLLFLDEPTTGFDPAARRAVWQVISQLRAMGKTIFLTTHYLEEAEVLADSIAVIKDGLIVAQGTPDNLGGREKDMTVIRFRCDPRLPAGLPDGWNAVIGGNGSVIMESMNPLERLVQLKQWAEAHGVNVADLSVHKPTLEDVYLNLTRDTTTDG